MKESIPSKLPTILLVISTLGLFATTALLAYQNISLQSQISSLETKISSKPTIPPTLTPLNPTSSWKTYKDEENSFELSYPQDLVTSPFYTGVYLIPSRLKDFKQDLIQKPHKLFDENEYWIEVSSNPAYETKNVNDLNLMFKTLCKTTSFYYCKMSLEKVTIAGIESYISTFETAEDFVWPSYTGWTIKDDIMHTMRLSSLNTKTLKTKRQLFDQILSTLKFTDQKGKFCGGIAGIACPDGLTCKLDGTYPDAGGTCEAIKIR